MFVKQFTAYTVTLGLTVLTGLTLTGCNNAEKQAELEKLQTENTALKQQVADLQGQITSAQPSTNANAPVSQPTYQTPSPQAFQDVTTDVPTGEMINDLAQLKVFEGLGPLFKPYQPITRGEYVQWLYTAYNAMRSSDKQIRLAPAYAVPYTDIQPAHPAYKFVQAFGNAGFSVGYENKTFKPDQPITREEMIAMKNGLDGGEKYATTTLPFSDKAQVDKRYLDAIYADYVIFNDDGPRGGNVQRAFGPIKAFKPKSPVLRYEAAATLWQTDHRGRITADTALGRVKQ